MRARPQPRYECDMVADLWPVPEASNDNEPVEIARSCACGRHQFIHFVCNGLLDRSPQGA